MKVDRATVDNRNSQISWLCSLNTAGDIILTKSTRSKDFLSKVSFTALVLQKVETRKL